MTVGRRTFGKGVVVLFFAKNTVHHVYISFSKTPLNQIANLSDPQGSELELETKAQIDN